MQKQAEITGETLLLAAAGVFTRVGYVNARLYKIIALAGSSKGALHDHFRSKDELAHAVIDAGSARFKTACDPHLTSAVSAVEALIDISCIMIDPTVNDVTVQAAFRLITEMRDHSDSDPTLFAIWLSAYRQLVRRAITEGDLRDEDPDAVALLLMETLAGVRLLAAVTGQLNDLPVRMTTTWDLLLPGLVGAPKLDHFRQLAIRKVTRLS
jgi:AcrR family transcriptional regulator